MKFSFLSQFSHYHADKCNPCVSKGKSLVECESVCDAGLTQCSLISLGIFCFLLQLQEHQSSHQDPHYFPQSNEESNPTHL